MFHEDKQTFHMSGPRRVTVAIPRFAHPPRPFFVLESYMFYPMTKNPQHYTLQNLSLSLSLSLSPSPSRSHFGSSHFGSSPKPCRLGCCRVTQAHSFWFPRSYGIQGSAGGYPTPSSKPPPPARVRPTRGGLPRQGAGQGRQGGRKLGLPPLC